MRREIDSGWRFGWWQVERDPVMDSIRDRPEFQELMGAVRADMASQLAGMPDYLPPSTAE